MPAWAGVKRQMPLEADEVVDGTGRAAMAAQLVLSGGEEGGAGADRFVGLEGDAVGVSVRPRTATPERISAPACRGGI